MFCMQLEESPCLVQWHRGAATCLYYDHDNEASKCVLRPAWLYSQSYGACERSVQKRRRGIPPLCFRLARAPARSIFTGEDQFPPDSKLLGRDKPDPANDPTNEGRRHHLPMPRPDDPPRRSYAVVWFWERFNYVTVT
jgi:hypothetical protein